MTARELRGHFLFFRPPTLNADMARRKESCHVGLFLKYHWNNSLSKRIFFFRDRWGCREYIGWGKSNKSYIQKHKKWKKDKNINICTCHLMHNLCGAPWLIYKLYNLWCTSCRAKKTLLLNLCHATYHITCEAQVVVWKKNYWKLVWHIAYA